MARARDILGMNARVQLYTSQNKPQAKKFGFSKLRAKMFLAKHGIPVPQLYARLTSQEELREFDWNSVSGSFAVKPANGSAGSGIIVIKRRLNEHEWLTIEDQVMSNSDLNLHASDILEGQYSTWGSRHMVIIEERVPLHPDLEKYAQVGTPDVRVIVYHKIPVMAMLRLPTEASRGRANLHQGAIALGIDFGTGKTTFGVDGRIAYTTFGDRRLLRVFPGSGLPVTGIEVPFWNDVLRTAIRVANATGLEYLGADVFLHPEKGPLVAEVNAFPGLSIQLANNAGLRYRLKKLEDLRPRNVHHAMKLAQSLFAENYPALTLSEADRPILQLREDILVYGDDEKAVEVKSLINTGRFRSVISEDLANRLKLNQPQDELWQLVEDMEGHVPVVKVSVKIRDRILHTTMIVSRRQNKKKTEIELGRNDLTGFLIAGEEI